MNSHPRSDAELVAAFTADADQAVSGAEFMRQRESAFHPRPGPHKPRLTRLAPILVIALIVGVAAVVTVVRSTGGGTIAPSGRSGCTADFRLTVAADLQSLPPDLGFTLTYTGTAPCPVLLAPPKVTVIDGDGDRMGVTSGGPAAGHTYPSLTVHRGDILGFGISRFLGCYHTPPSHYTVEIVTPTASGAATSVSAPLTIGGGNPYAGPPPTSCATTTIGDVSPLTITSISASSTGLLRGTLAAVGGPAPGLARPLSGSVQITNTRTHTSRVVAVDANGLYSISLPPGTYEIAGRQYNAGTAYTCHPLHTAAVTAGHTTTTDVYCQEN